MVLTFHKPTAKKTGNITTYSFRVETDQSLTATIEDSIATALAAAEHTSWLTGFVNEFLRTSSSYFSKPTTTPALLKLLKHEILDGATVSGSCVCVPQEITIVNGAFSVLWSITAEPISISIPDLGPDAPTEGLEATEVDALPEAEGNEVLELQVPNARNQYDKQLVKEAYLRAKLAQYKANRAHMEYVEKYGEEPSDSEDSEYEDESE
jgi:hypothetical protein